MSLFLDYVYMTDVALRGIIRVNRHTGEPPETVNSEKMQSIPVDVKVIHPLNQPTVETHAAFTPGQ